MSLLAMTKCVSPQTYNYSLPNTYVSITPKLGLQLQRITPRYGGKLNHLTLPQYDILLRKLSLLGEGISKFPTSGTVSVRIHVLTINLKHTIHQLQKSNITMNFQRKNFSINMQTLRDTIKGLQDREDFHILSTTGCGL